MPYIPNSQPAPTPNDRPSVHDKAIEVIRRRKEFGLKKYGTFLQPFNGRPALSDAIEEVADLHCYLQQEQDERAILIAAVQELLTAIDFSKVPAVVSDRAAAVQTLLNQMEV